MGQAVKILMYREKFESPKRYRVLEDGETPDTSNYADSKIFDSNLVYTGNIFVMATKDKDNINSLFVDENNYLHSAVYNKITNTLTI